MAQVTLTERIADYLREKIDSEQLEAGAALPSETDLATLHHCGRGTVRRALANLMAEGRITAVAGVGYFVRRYQLLLWRPDLFEHLAHRRDTPDSGHDAWAADIIDQGRVPRQVVEVSVVPAPPNIAARLDLADGATVVARRRMRFVDEEPFQLADTYYPYEIAVGTEVMTAGDVVVPGGLMAHIGHPQSRFVDDIGARMPLPSEVNLLDLEPGTAIIEHLRIGYNQHNRPVRVIVTIAPGDRHRLIYDLAAR